MNRGWLGVACASHVERGIERSFAQINHGKRAGLERMTAGDTLIYYSPTRQSQDKALYQHFTAMGVFPDHEIWQADEGDFRPFRRRIEYADARPVPLGALRERLQLTTTPNWGYQLRFGIIPLDPHDVAVIREAMTP